MLKLPDLTMPSSRLQASERRVLEVQVGVVDAVAEELAEDAVELRAASGRRAPAGSASAVRKWAHGDLVGERS